MKRASTGIMLIILLAIMLTLAFNIQPAKGEWTGGPIYIRADGSIDPPEAPITTYDNITYTLTDNISSSGDGIIVERDNIVIDGAGYTLQGSGAYGSKGVDLSSRSNVTVKKISIKNFWRGIRLYLSSNNSISGNNITNNCYGVVISYSSNNRIIENNITANSEDGVNIGSSSSNIISGNGIISNHYGVDVDDSSSNTINGNNIAANDNYGIALYYSSSNNRIIENNIIANNWCGIRLFYCRLNNIISGNNITGHLLYGIDLDHSSNHRISRNVFMGDGLFVWSSYDNVVVDNVVNGRPLVYLEGISDYTIGDAGQVILVKCNNITVENLNLSNTTVGVELWETNNTKITKNNVRANNFFGIYLRNSSDNSISGNNITANKYYGIWLDYSSDNSISGNNITANKYYGIHISSSSNNRISVNSITNNYYGIDISSSSNISIRGNNIINNYEGISLSPSSNSSVSGNGIINNYYGIVVYYSSSNNRIIENNIIANEGGIYLGYYSSNNSIYHNNFLGNAKQVVFLGKCVNVWDDGYPSGGNYWSDYTGGDLYSGPYQNKTGSDGIGDTPYVIDADNIDRYPLMNPYIPLSVSIAPTSAEILVGESLTFTSDVSGGRPPYSYQWFVNGTAVGGTNSQLWTFTPTRAGTYIIHLNVTDSAQKTAKSNTATITVAPQLMVSISPSASILVGQSVKFTSAVSGGYPPYSYQWYLNGNPVSGANSNTWIFTPTISGIYYVQLKVKDDKGNIAQSDAARITVAAVPVGGHSIPIQAPSTTKYLTLYLILTAVLTIALSTIKHKTKRKNKT